MESGASCAITALPTYLRSFNPKERAVRERELASDGPDAELKTIIDIFAFLRGPLDGTVVNLSIL